ncbi:hypothetical protein [Paenibacillus ihuae]|uniref:hypothetical protein n=1 Tax=Paenibacillus ihuae TaxID=1232431 RepID=UPI0006D5846E|nr:hypothetical protein [Paenibacillus ihuae]
METNEFGEPLPIFNEEQMFRLIHKDKYLMFVFKDMSKRGHSRTLVLEVLFNENILGDTAYTDEYEACAETMSKANPAD